MLGRIRSLLAYVKTVVDSILALVGVANPAAGDTATIMGFNKLIYNQLGQDDPVSADRTSAMNYLKLLENQIGTDNPTTADQTTVMNFLKQIKDGMGGGKLCKASNSIQHSQGNLTFTASAQSLMLVGRFIPGSTGTVRLSLVTDSTSTGSRLYLVGPAVNAAQNATDNPGMYAATNNPGQNPITVPIGTVIAGNAASYGTTDLTTVSQYPATPTVLTFDISVTAGIPILLWSYASGVATTHVNSLTIAYEVITAPVFG